MKFYTFILPYFLEILLFIFQSQAKVSHKRSSSTLNNKFYKHFTKAAVATDIPFCSTVGKNILKQNGSTVDSAIAAMLCVGIINFQATSIGGVGFMTIFDKKSEQVEVIDFGGTTPSGMNDEDYNTSPPNKRYYIDEKLKFGGKSVLVPGMVKGFEVAHKKYGRLPWKMLFETAANIAEKGFTVTEATRHAYVQRERFLKSPKYSTLRNVLKDFKKPRSETVNLKLKNPELARTLRIVAKAGSSNPFYNGSIAQEIVKVIAENGGTMTLEDLRNYKPIIRKPIKVKLGNQTLYTSPPPSAGAILARILKILKGYNFTPRNVETLDEEIRTTHRIIEAMKWSFAKPSILTDPDYFEITSSNSNSPGKLKRSLGRQKSLEEVRRFLDDHQIREIRKNINDKKSFLDPLHYEQDGIIDQRQGTTHVSVLSPEGDAVSMTTTMNNYFGSLIFSKTLGFIFNNQMKDFKDYGSQSHGRLSTAANYIVKGKRSSSFMCPSIVLNSHGDVSMVIGAAGGSQIPSTLAEVFVNYFWLDMDLKSANEKLRFHNQLTPAYVFVENKFAKNKKKKLEKLGHIVSYHTEIITGIKASYLGVCHVIGVKQKTSQGPYIEAASDSRRQGEPDGF